MAGSANAQPLARWLGQQEWPCTLARLLIIIGLFVLLRSFSGSSSQRRGLHTSNTPRGIVDLELAGNIARMDKILDTWGPSRWQRARSELFFDFIFIAMYVPTLYIGVLCAAIHWETAGFGLAAGVGVVLAWSQLVVGVLDVIENGLLLKEVGTRLDHADLRARWVPRAARRAAFFKFVLTGAGVIYTLSVPVVRLLQP